MKLRFHPVERNFLGSTFLCSKLLRRSHLGRCCYHSYRAMASTSRKQPLWQQPKASSDASKLPPLDIYNSLRKEKKTRFIPIDSKIVTWYACGPTVYDDAHLGHARTYLTSDIIRRILRDYFGFKVRYVMNITDVDDKVCMWLYEH